MLTINDMDGRVVYSVQILAGKDRIHTISVADLSRGMYVVQLISTSGFMVNRFIKN